MISIKKRRKEQENKALFWLYHHNNFKFIEKVFIEFVTVHWLNHLINKSLLGNGSNKLLFDK